MCRKSGEACKRRLVHSDMLIINNVSLLKSFIANVLKCKARLKGNFKCMCILNYVFLRDESLLM